MLPAAPLKACIGPPEHPPNGSGRIAQLVEQLTLNQRVLGSSPSASTIPSNDLAAMLAERSGFGHAIAPRKADFVSPAALRPLLDQFRTKCRVMTTAIAREPSIVAIRQAAELVSIYGHADMTDCCRRTVGASWSGGAR